MDIDSPQNANSEEKVREVCLMQDDLPLVNLGLTPQSAQKVSEMAASMTEFMHQPKPIEQMITFEVAIDDEVSIPANCKYSQSQASMVGGDEKFYSAASGSYSMEEPMMMSIDNTDSAINCTISKESMPALLDENIETLGRSNGISNDRRKSLSDEEAVQEIDPHGLIAFDSPSRFAGQRSASTRLPTESLLDVDIMTSPQSMARYSQRDFDRLRVEFERRAEKQAEFMQFEIQTLQERYDSSLLATNELRTLMAEYEKTMAQILDARRHQSDQLSTVEQLLQDKRKLQVDLHSSQLAHQNLHSRYSEVKTLNEQLRVHEQALKASIASLQAELSNADRRFEALRQHAEQKLQDANTQLQRLQSNADVELSATKAKLLKAELRIASLEESLASKVKENRELGAICDELIQKIDPSAVAVTASAASA